MTETNENDKYFRYHPILGLIYISPDPIKKLKSRQQRRKQK
jgi:hypothetical protein